MRTAAAILLGVLTLACAACGKKPQKEDSPAAPPPGGGQPGPAPDSAPPAGATGPAFLDATKDVPPRLEWNRDINSTKGGTILFRVTTPGPIAVTLVTDKGYQALTRGDKAGFNKSDVLLTADGGPPGYERRVAVPPGRLWFIIENRSASPAHIRLECFAAN
jgi:hypothetical protein